MHTNNGLTENKENIMTTSLVKRFSENGDVYLANLTDEEKEKYNRLNSSLVVKDINSVSNFGSELQASMTKYSNDFLNAVRTSKCGENKIMTPEKQEMDVGDFLASLKVITAEEFYGDIDGYTDNKRVYATFEKYENLPFRVMTQKYGTQMVDYQNICDANGRLYIELDLTKPYVEIGQTITRYIGLSNLYNISSDDFVVAWLYRE